MNGWTDERMVPFPFSPLAEVQALPWPTPKPLLLWGLRPCSKAMAPHCVLLKPVNKWMSRVPAFTQSYASHPAALSGALVWLDPLLTTLSILDSRLPWFSQAWPTAAWPGRRK